MMNYKVKTLKKMLCIKQDVWEDLEAITPKGNSTQDLIRHMIKRCLYDRVWSQYYIRSSKKGELKKAPNRVVRVDVPTDRVPFEDEDTQRSSDEEESFAFI